MAVGRQMMLVLRIALDVHVPRIPVALLGNTLRRPMRPDAELRVAEPIGTLIVGLERFPSRFERAGSEIMLCNTELCHE